MAQSLDNQYKNEYTENFVVELAYLVADVYLPEISTDPLNLDTLQKYWEEDPAKEYITMDKAYENMIGYFYIPTVFPVIKKDDPVEIEFDAPATRDIKTENALKANGYSEANFLPLLIPKYICMNFRFSIPAGTKFLVTFTGGKTTYSNINICGLYGHDMQAEIEEEEQEIIASATTEVVEVTDYTTGEVRTVTIDNTYQSSPEIRVNETVQYTYDENIQRSTPSGGLDFSRLIPNDYWNPGGGSGSLTTDNFNGRRMVIYTPPGYSSSRQYDIFYFKMGTNNTPEQFWNWPGIFSNFNFVIDHMINSGELKPVIIVAIQGNPANQGWLQNNAEGLINYVETKYSTYMNRDMSKAISSSAHRAVGGWSLGAIECRTTLVSTNFWRFFKYWDIQSGYNASGMESIAGRDNLYVACVAGSADDGGCKTFTNTCMNIFRSNSWFNGKSHAQIVQGYTHSVQFQIRYFFNAVKFFFGR